MWPSGAVNGPAWQVRLSPFARHFPFFSLHFLSILSILCDSPHFIFRSPLFFLSSSFTLAHPAPKRQIVTWLAVAFNSIPLFQKLHMQLWDSTIDAATSLVRMVGCRSHEETLVIGKGREAAGHGHGGRASGHGHAAEACDDCEEHGHGHGAPAAPVHGHGHGHAKKSELEPHGHVHGHGKKGVPEPEPAVDAPAPSV